MTSNSSGRVSTCWSVMSAIASLITMPAPGFPSGIRHQGPPSSSTAPNISFATWYPQSRKAPSVNFMMLPLWTRVTFRDWGYQVPNISFATWYPQSRNVTLVHKGNIMKFTEGAFRDWGYQVAKQFFGAVELDGGPWCRIPEGRPGAGLVIKDAIADITLQQVLTRPDEFDVIATPNLNGDYLSDALAAQVGGIGIAPGGNINYISGHAIFEATHGTAPKYANQDKVNPGSVVLSGEMMLRYMGWTEAADLVLKGLNGAISAKRVTYDFARLMEGATEIKCSAFGDAVIAHM